MTRERDRGSFAARFAPNLARYAIYSSLFLAWIFLLFIFTAGRSDPRWLADWEKWDALWYRQIWIQGYFADPKTLVFPPGYSWLIGSVSRLFFLSSRGSLPSRESLSFLGTAVLLNLAALYATAALISNWLSRTFSVSPYLLFAFVLSAPAAFFAFTSYSDIVFMLLLWVALWLALSPSAPRGGGNLIAQCAILLVLPWIRLTGYALAAWLVDRRWAAATVFVSLALWLGFNRAIAGSPFCFLHAQEIFAMPSGNFFEGVASSVQSLTSNDLHNHFLAPWLQFGFLPLFYFGSLALAALWLVKRGERLMALTVISILLFSHNQSVWRSVVRYDLPLLPVLCLPLLVTPRSRAASYAAKAAFGVLLIAQFALQFYFARVFHSGGGRSGGWTF